MVLSQQLTIKKENNVHNKTFIFVLHNLVWVFMSCDHNQDN